MLACLLLAGKIIDRPISMRRLVEMADRVSFPGHSSNNRTDGISSSRIMSADDYGEPKTCLIKEYETHLLLVGFGMVAPTFDSFSLLPDIDYVSQLLVLDCESKQRFESTIFHPGFSHSALCLLEDTIIVSLGLYLFSCQNSGISPSPRWGQSINDEERVTAEKISEFMMKTAGYVEQRRRRIDLLKMSTSVPINRLEQDEIELPYLHDLLKNITMTSDVR